MNKIPIANYICGGLFLGMIYLIISVIFKEKDLQHYTFTDTELKKSARNIVVISILLFCLIMALAVLHVRDKLYPFLLNGIKTTSFYKSDINIL